jgi:hypothetical protein
MRRRRLSTTALGAVILSACGGSGSSHVSTPAPPAATYMLSGTLSNLAPGSNGVTLALNETVQGIYGTNGGVQFPPLPSGSYTISIAAQPSKPPQTCSVSPASVVIVNTDINNISVSCTPTYYTIGGVVHGIANTTLTLATQVNGSAATYMPLTDQSYNYPTFTYPAAALPGTTYNTSITVQPSGPGFSATCEFAPGTQSGTVPNANVTSIVVNCTASPAPPPVAQIAISTDGQTLSLFKLSPALANTGSAPTPLQILQTPNITGAAADASGTIYYTANAGTPGSNAALYVCPTPSVAGQPYSCAPFPNGYASAIPGGKLLNGGLLLEASITSSGTTIYGLSPNPTAASYDNPTGAIQPLTPIYTSNGTPVDVSAQEVSQLFTTRPSGFGPPALTTGLFVTETDKASTFGSGVRAYACMLPCNAGAQTDITQSLLAAIGTPGALSGQITGSISDGLGDGNFHAVVGLANPYGNGAAPSVLSTVAKLQILLSGPTSSSVLASSAKTLANDEVSFPLLSNNLSPFIGTSALAQDPLGQLFVAQALTNQGQSIAPTTPPLRVPRRPPAVQWICYRRFLSARLERLRRK